MQSIPVFVTVLACDGETWSQFLRHSFSPLQSWQLEESQIDLLDFIFMYKKQEVKFQQALEEIVLPMKT